VLNIRKEQLDVLAVDQRKRFLARMVTWIATEHANRHDEWGEQGTVRFVQSGIEKAASYGILTEGAIAVMLELMIEVGLDFERAPDRKWIHNMLAHRAMPGFMKMDVIRERIQSCTQGRTIVIHRSKGG
jgi:hypothetical protein